MKTEKELNEEGNPMDTPITRAEFTAYKEKCEAEHKRLDESRDAMSRRLEEEDRRQNRRIDGLEDTMKELSSISSAVEKLAVNMENMCKVQERQGKRLEALESRDGELWRKAVGYLLTAVLGAVAALVFRQIGLS